VTGKSCFRLRFAGAALTAAAVLCTLVSGWPGGAVGAQTIFSPRAADNKAAPPSGVASSPLPSPTASNALPPSAAPSATGSATSAMPSLPPLVPPHDAPPVRTTTPPLGAVSPAPAMPLPESMWLGGDQEITLPLALHAGRPYVSGLLNGHPAVFILDTSAVTTLVDTAIIGNRMARRVAAIQFGELHLPHVAIVAAPVRAFSETFLGSPADAVIGRDLIEAGPLTLDYPQRTLTLYRSGVPSPTPLAGATILALRVLDDRPAVAASLDGQAPSWFALATGAGFGVRLEPGSDIASRLARERWIPYTEETPNAGTMTGRLVRARSMSLGGLLFYQPLVALVGAQESPASGLAGALGSGLLSRLIVTLNEAQGSATFVAPPGATRPQLFDPSGLVLAMRRDAIVVERVLPGSGAAEAHLRPGDDILSINGLAPATLDFARELLDGSPGTKVRVVFRRFGILHTATFVLRVLI
jgi:hypothetical protein